MSDRARLVALFMAMAILAAAALALAGCGDSQKSGVISREQYDRIQKGLTLDEVEAIGGEPYRTHKTGTSKDPNIFWYYSKTEGDGLVRISFLSGRVDSISPYEISVTPEE